MFQVILVTQVVLDADGSEGQPVVMLAVIAQAIRSPEGHTFTGQLQPGQSVTVVVITPGPSPDCSLINLEAYWNPQVRFASAWCP